MATQLKHVIIGTAGHIDHGKTRLVARLSGIDTDRLPEEKARGISIDLGFAHWEAGGFQFGIVDVPGHERFIKNMVAGATGMNLALLAVAADDGVMPQTREHLEIMDLLGVQTGVVAITKTDLVEAELVELVEAELEELTAGTFLEGCPIIPVSSESGAGIDRLREKLAEVAEQYQWPSSATFFRMPIDSVYSIEGHGTVVTGTVLSGEVQPGESLELLPAKATVRVRSVQNHGVEAAESGVRQRTAINLAGVKADDVHRGDELAAIDFMEPTRRLLVELKCLSHPGVTLKHRGQFTLHMGTSETAARLILKEGPVLPGTTGYAEIRLARPVVATYGQRFILRRQSPALTVGGGQILDPHIAPRRRIKDVSTLCEALHNHDPAERLSAVYAQLDTVDTRPEFLAWRAGLAADQAEAALDTLRKNGVLRTLRHKERKFIVHRQRVEDLSQRILKRIRGELARHQPRRALPQTTLLTACRNMTQPGVLEAVFESMLKEGSLARVGNDLGPADAQVKLSKKQRAQRDAIIETIHAGGLAPPTTKELAAQLELGKDQLGPLIHLCVEDGLLIRISDELYFTPAAVESAVNICRKFISESGPSTMSQLREAWGISRKYAVPLCEFLDEQGVTVRDGDLRQTGPG